MDKRTLFRFWILVDKLHLPEDRKIPTGGNLRWILRNAGLVNSGNPNLHKLLDLVKQYV